MKKPLAIVLMLAMLCSLLALSACQTTRSEDLSYIRDKGTLVVGVVDAPPLTYEEDGEWAGFAVDLCKGFAKQLGVEAEFKEIDWSQKEKLLDDKTIDCVSSAMTITPERREAMECSNAYLTNQQIVVTKADIARRYTSAEECLNLKFAVLDGSTHEELAKENGFLRVTTATTEEALQAVEDGRVDAAITNYTTAMTMIGEGNEFPDLARAFRLATTQFGVGFRKGSDLAAQFNDYLVTMYTGGSLKTMAKPYGVEKLLVEQVTER